MELRRVTDALLRCHASPLHLGPSPRPLSASYRNPLKRPFQRTFTHSTPRFIARSPPITTSAISPPKRRSDAIQKDLQALWALKPQKSIRPLDSEMAKRMNAGHSDADLMKSLKNSSKGLARMGKQATDFGEMMDPLTGQISKEKKELIPKPHPIRLTAVTGRTVNVAPGVDIGRAFTLLAQQVGRNGVRRDFSKQVFHERPGLKRKRLASMRWRKRFMDGFQAAVQRVTALKKQGW